MALQRFLPDVDRTRRAVGWTFLVVFVGPLAWILRLMAGGHPNGTAIVLFLLIAGMLAIGARLAFWPREFLEIDLEARKFEVIRKGKRSYAGALDSLGPLEIRMRSRVVGTGSKQRTVTEYVVVAAIQSKIDLYSMNTSAKARRKMEALARLWSLSCQSYGGAVRRHDALDTPLHERLRGDSATRATKPLAPEWGVHIEATSPGYTMKSTHRSWAPLQTTGLMLIVALFFLRGPVLAPILDSVRGGDLLVHVLAALMGVLALVMLWLAATGIRDTFFPGTVHINEDGVSYRGRRMRFSQIEEVTTTAPIEIVGDRKIIALAPTFCPRPAVGPVVHELQRLIVEVASSSPDTA